MPKRSRKYRSLPLVALVLAWLIPGAGHVYIGRARRGFIIFLIIGATFWAGVAMGGVMTVDYQNERWWFIADMFTGTHGLIGWRLQKAAYGRLQAKISQDSEFRKLAEPLYYQNNQRSRDELRHLRQMFTDKYLAAGNLALVTPTDTVARAYAGVAGLLNLMCIFDAVMLSLLGVAGEPATARRNTEQDKE